jgi:hypothetical protein
MGVAYVPLAPAPQNDIQAPTKIDIPSYPDKGVAYAGFSKTIFSGNSYQLNPQSLVDFNSSANFLGGESGVSIAMDATKDFYCSKIVLMSWHPGASANIDTINVRSGSTDNKLILHEMSVFTTAGFTNMVNLDFNVPLLFQKGQSIVVNYSRARDAGDKIVINLYGWLE